MKFSNYLTAAGLATVLFAASSFLPAKFGGDAAFALPAATAEAPAATTPWVGLGISAGAVSVILNGAIVGKTQCRELTLKEAYTSILLPFVGILFNENASACGKKMKKK